MNRRRFLGGLLGSLYLSTGAVAQPGRIHRIGWLDLSSTAENVGIFERAMAARGWIKGTSFSLDYRGGDRKVERLATVTSELIRLPVDVIVAPGTPEALAAKNATKTVPIVMAAVDDPVARGLVVTLARPGRNITGISGARRELSGKLLALVHEVVPGSSRVAVLWDSTDPEHRVVVGDLRATAKKINVSLNAVEVQEYTDVEPAFATIKRQGNKVLIVPSSSMLVPRWIADLAVTHGLALASTSAAYAYEGGLVAYTDDWNAVFERVATFVDRILKGAKPQDLPVEVPSRFNLILNAKTARLLKIAIPPSIAARATAVIE